MKCVHLDTNRSQLFRACDGHILRLRPYVLRSKIIRATSTNLAKFLTCFGIIV